MEVSDWKRELGRKCNPTIAAESFWGEVSTIEPNWDTGGVIDSVTEQLNNI
jgi:hypothetical protein